METKQRKEVLNTLLTFEGFICVKVLYIPTGFKTYLKYPVEICCIPTILPLSFELINWSWLRKGGERERESKIEGKKLSIESSVTTHFKFERFWIIGRSFLRRKKWIVILHL